MSGDFILIRCMVLVIVLFLYATTLQITNLHAKNNPIYSDKEIVVLDHISEKLNTLTTDITENKNEIRAILQDVKKILGFKVELKYRLREVDGKISLGETQREKIIFISQIARDELQKNLGKGRYHKWIRILNVLKDCNLPFVRRDAYTILLKHLYARGIEEEIESLLTSSNKYDQYTAITLLSDRFNKKCLPLLQKIYNECPEHSTCKFETSCMMIKLGSRIGITTLYHFVNSKNENQEKAFEILSAYGRKEDFAYLANVLVDGNVSQSNMLDCFRYVCKHSENYNNNTKRKLIQFYKKNQEVFNKNNASKMAAIRFLHEIDAENSHDLIANYLLNPHQDKSVLSPALSMLGFNQDKKYLPLVAAYLHHPSVTVQNYALFAFENILQPKGKIITRSQMQNKYSDMEKLLKERKLWWKENQDKYSISNSYKDILPQLVTTINEMN